MHVDTYVYKTKLHGIGLYVHGTYNYYTVYYIKYNSYLHSTVKTAFPSE